LTFRTWTKYLYNSIDGEGITAYIVDTGINIHHVDFEGRATWGATIPEGDADEDGNGHGTHVAGTIGGKIHGVAKKANLVAVKVLRSNGSGSMSDVVSGVQWVAEAHALAVKEAQKASGSSKSKASVANMSLGGGFSRALNMAVNAAVDAGVHFAVAAGNDNRDACQYSPASAEKAITVGATTITDDRAWFSNYGKCTDVFAPGHNIKSTWIGSKTATNTISGTSMASPHVCGLMAYLLSLEEDPSAVTPKQLKDKIIELATRKIINDMPKETKNRLIYSGIDAEFNDDGWFGWIKTVVDKFTITL
jgi:cerevisin